MKKLLFVFAILFFWPITSLAAPSLRIQNISPGTSLRSGETLVFTVVPTELSSPLYSSFDSYPGSTLASTSVSTNGIFSWTPAHHEGGVHTLTIQGIDGSGKIASTSLTVNIEGAKVSLNPATSTLSVVVGKPLTFSLVTSGLTSPNYTISDTYPATTLNNTNLDGRGVFYWIPGMSDVGNHTVSIVGTDWSRRTASTTVTITVLPPTISIESLSPGTTVGVDAPLSFTVSAFGFTYPRFNVSDSFFGSTITNANLNSDGKFTWYPGLFQLGSHTISVNVVDAFGRSATTSVTVNVEKQGAGHSLTLSQPSPNQRTGFGSAVSFQSRPVNFVPTTYTVTDSFTNSSVGKDSINSSGFFSWIPKESDVGTHVITVTASDAGGKSATASNTVIVTKDVVSSTPSTVSGYGLGTITPIDITPYSQKFVFTLSLGLGSKGNEVIELQKKLKGLGIYNGATNGTFGPMTQAAVKRFQAQNKITQTGSVGPITRAALNK